MRLSRSFIPTLKETPAEAQIASHRLMLRAGLVRQTLYHIQRELRDEVRPRFGVMRGRECLMKDAYSFDMDYAGAVVSYRKMMLAYMRTFQRMGLKAIPMEAESGPIGGDLSHEFIILAS